MWTLRGRLTANDAAYVALAETLGAVLVTMDGKIARALSRYPCGVAGYACENFSRYRQCQGNPVKNSDLRQACSTANDEEVLTPRASLNIG